MKIAIVVYSQTGHTKSIAEQAQERLQRSGHEVDYLPIQLEPKKEEQKSSAPPAFINLPKLEGYDLYIFGAYVEAFALARVMQAYLKQIEKINAKAISLTTQHFMKSFLGGNAAQKTMTRLLTKKGLDVLGSVHVNWKIEEGRPRRIASAVDAICELV